MECFESSWESWDSVGVWEGLGPRCHQVKYVCSRVPGLMLPMHAIDTRYSSKTLRGRELNPGLPRDRRKY